MHAPRWSYLPAVLLAFVIVGLPSQASADNHDRPDRIRLLDSYSSWLFRTGLASSSSFQELVARVSVSDVVVYIRREDLPAQLNGRLQFVTAAGGRRYVLISLRWRGASQDQVAALAHELQHAVEIADTPAIVDQQSLAAAYRRLGFKTSRSGNGWAFESAAAIEAGVRVLRQLKIGRGKSRRTGALRGHEQVRLPASGV